MARPQKEGLDYFPLDVDIDQDDKVALIEAQHGIVGFGIVIKLLMKVYKNGYYYSWTEKEQLLFSKIVNVDINTLNEVVNDCIKWGLFSNEVYKKEHVLTSKGIQLRYLEATTRRQQVKIKKEHLLICSDKVNEYKNLSIEGVNVDINSDNDVVNVNINPQSKVKESKEKNLKDYTSKIKDLLPDFSSISNFNELNKKYWDVIRETRTTGKVSPSVIYNTMSKWKKYDPVIIQYALKTHIEVHAGKREEYTIGIMRGTSKEEAADRLNSKVISFSKHHKSPSEIDWEAL